MAKLEMIEAPVGNRLVCKCGGETFFILAEAEETPGEPIGGIECVACHTMYHLRLAGGDTKL